MTEAILKQIEDYDLDALLILLKELVLLELRKLSNIQREKLSNELREKHEIALGKYSSLYVEIIDNWYKLKDEDKIKKAIANLTQDMENIKKAQANIKIKDGIKVNGTKAVKNIYENELRIFKNKRSKLKIKYQEFLKLRENTEKMLLDAVQESEYTNLYENLYDLNRKIEENNNYIKQVEEKINQLENILSSKWKYEMYDIIEEKELKKIFERSLNENFSEDKNK